MLNRSKQPDIKEIESINFLRPEEFCINGHIPVYLFKNSSNLISIQLVFNTGRFQQDMPLQASFTSRMLNEGSENYSAGQIAETLDYCGARLNAQTNKDSTSVSLITSKKHWEKLTALLADIVFRPIFPEKELKTSLNIALQQFIINQEKVTVLSKSKFEEVLFGNTNFYGYPNRKEDFYTLQQFHLLDFHKKNFHTDNLKIIISGNVDNHAIKILEKALEVENPKTKPKALTLKIDSHIEREHYVLKKGGVQCAINMGGVSINRLHPDDMPLRILNMVLGGYFGSRLMSNLREDKGYTYGIGSSIVSLRHAGYFVISTQLGNSFLQDAIKQIFHEIDLLRNEKIKKGELNLVKNYMLGSILKSTDGHLNLCNLLNLLLIYDLNMNYFDSYVNEIKTITSEKLLNIAQKYFNPSSMYCVVAGEQKKQQ